MPKPPIEFRRLDSIAFWKKTPPALGGKLSILSPEAFEKILGCQYTESIQFADGISDEKLLRLQKQETLEPASRAADEDWLTRLHLLQQQPNTKLGVAFINEAVGYATISTETIKEGEILCIYSGTFRTYNPETEAETATKALIDNPYLLYLKELEDGTNYLCDAYKTRGMAGLMAHLPTPLSKPLAADGSDVTFETLCELDEIDWFPDGEKYQTANDIIKNIACANVTRQQIIFQGIPIEVLHANRDIPEHTLVGFSYELESPKFSAQI